MADETRAYYPRELKIKGSTQSSGQVPGYDRQIPEFDKIHLKKVGGYIDRNVVRKTTKMRTVVRLIRMIGETVANRKKIIQGQKDWQLSPTGLDQVHLVAGRLQNEKFTHVFSSDLNRAAETAKVIVENNKSCERTIIVHDKRLRERKFGIVEGKNYRELVSAAKKTNTSVANYTPTGAESLQQIQDRAKSFFRDLCEQVRKSCRVEDGTYTPAPIKRRYEDAIDDCLHEQDLHPSSADTLDGVLPSPTQVITSALEEDSEHKRRRHALNNIQKLDANQMSQSANVHESSAADCNVCTNDADSQSCANGSASSATITPTGALNGECCNGISVDVGANGGGTHPGNLSSRDSSAAVSAVLLSVDVPTHSVQPASSASLVPPNSLLENGASTTAVHCSATQNGSTHADRGVCVVSSTGSSPTPHPNTNGSGAMITSNNVANGTGNSNMKRSNSSSSSGFSSLLEENELLDSDDNSIATLEDYCHQQNNNDDSDDDDDDDDDDFCSKDSDSCYDSPFTVPVSDADVRSNIPCPKFTQYGCPNVSLSPLLEHRHSTFSSMSSGRSSSFDDGDSSHQNVADVLIVSHGGFLKELIRLFIDELECKFPGGKGHALRLSPNTGVSKFTITVGEPNKVLVTCLLIHDKDHLLTSSLNSFPLINPLSALPILTGHSAIDKRSPPNNSSPNVLPTLTSPPPPSSPYLGANLSSSSPVKSSTKTKPPLILSSPSPPSSLSTICASPSSLLLSSSREAYPGGNVS